METNYALSLNVQCIYTFMLKQLVSPLARGAPGIAYYTLGLSIQSKGWETQLLNRSANEASCRQLTAIN